MSAAIGKLVDEDPSLRFEQDPELQQSLLWGQGEMHLRVALDRLRSKYHIGIEGRPPQTPYRETIRKGTQSHGRHKKQSGGHGQFGDVKIEIRPRQRGEGFEFIDKIVGGAVPRQYIPAVEAGARDFLQPRPARLPGGRRQRHAVRRPVPQRRQLGDRVQDGDRARVARRPAELRSGAARADPRGRDLGAFGLHLARARAGQPEARPDPGLRHQGRLERLGPDLDRTCRRPRSTT